MNKLLILRAITFCEILLWLASIVLAVIWLKFPQQNFEPVLTIVGFLSGTGLEFIRRWLNSQSGTSTRRIEAQLTAVQEIKRESVPLMNKISSAAFPLRQGRSEAGRDAEEILQRWVMEYRNILPEKVMNPLHELHQRVINWRLNMGANDTPADMIEGKNAPFPKLLQAIESLEKELLDA